MSAMPDAQPRRELTDREKRLLDDLGKEYYALVDAVAGVDGRLMTVKGWSVTLSLAALGLGFQQGHYALFGLGAATAAAFWFLDGLMKGHQLRYYPRMRDIEVAACELNSVESDTLQEVSAPRVDSMWSYRIKRGDTMWRNHPPERRDPAAVRRLRGARFVLPNVMFPHMLAVALGVTLFLAARFDWWQGLEHLQP